AENSWLDDPGLNRRSAFSYSEINRPQCCACIKKVKRDTSMKKLLLSAGFATLLASTALAQTSQTFNECRQIDGALHWFLVTYSMFEEPAPTGHRIPTEVQDTGTPCTAADYEQSRQYA